jgi:hypothetical protein
VSRKRIELAGLRVLVADSQWLLALETVNQLRREGVEVEGPVATVGAALDIVHARPLDAAIIETGLRGGDLSALRSLLTARDVPVAWITDSTQGPASSFDRSADPARYLRRLLAPGLG